MEPIRIIRDIKELQDTFYAELLPGEFLGERWNDGSLFVDGAVFALFKVIIQRQEPSFEHCAFGRLARPAGKRLAVDLERLADRAEVASGIGDVIEDLAWPRRFDTIHRCQMTDFLLWMFERQCRRRKRTRGVIRPGFRARRRPPVQLGKARRRRMCRAFGLPSRAIRQSNWRVAGRISGCRPGSELVYYLTDAQLEFAADFRPNADALARVARELAGWLREQLQQHECVWVLGV